MLKRRSILPLIATPVAFLHGGSATAAVTGVTAGDGVRANGAPNGVITTTGTISEASTIDVTTTAFGAKVDGVMGFGATVTNGSANFSDGAAHFQAGDVGKTIAIVGAGAAGAHLVTTIKTVSSATSIVLNANAGGASPTGWYIYGTDDTSAWQAALNAAVGGGRVIGPSGISVIAGALVTAGGFNAQITLATNPNGSDESYGIEVVGPWPPPGATFWPAKVPNTGLILFSPLLGSGTRPAIIGSVQGSFNYIRLNIRNALFRTMPNPSMSAVDGTWIASFSLFDCYVDTLQSVDQQTAAPTNTGGVGFYCSGRGSQCLWSIERVYVTGYYLGWRSGECGYINNAFAFSCAYACANPTVDYPTEYGLVVVSWCPVGMFWNGDHQCNIESFLTEQWNVGIGHGAAWMASTANFDDNGTAWAGNCRAFYEVTATVGREGRLLINGCAGATITPSPSGYNAASITDTTLGSTLGAVAGATVTVGAGGDQIVDVTAVLSLNAVTGTVLVEMQLYDVTAAGLLAGTLSLCWYEEFGVLTVTRVVSVTKRFRFRSLGPSGRQYKLYATANNNAGGGVGGTSVILRGTAWASGGSVMTLSGAD